MKRTHQSGFGLLDALIGVGVLAAGVLVLLAAVNRAQANARELRDAQIATQLLQDLAARMHLNRHLNPSAQVAALYLHTFDTSLPNPVHCDSEQTCDATALAQHDLAAWGQHVQLDLPEGNFAITTSSADRNLVAVMVAWRARGDAAPPTLDSGLHDLTCPDQYRCLLSHIRP